MWRDFWINMVAASPMMPQKLRWLIYRMYGISSETRAISPRCFIGSTKLQIGKNTFINYDVFFDGTGPITIGRNCRIGIAVMFVTSEHLIGKADHRAGPVQGRPIIVGDGCWIGARATILPGITIEPGCVIAAGAMVTKDCLANGVYAGVPSRRIRDLSEQGDLSDLSA